jgi:hypothetical protein
MLVSEFLDALMDGGGTNMVDDFEASSCPVCGDPDCTFPPECADAVGVWPEPTYGEE